MQELHGHTAFTKSGTNSNVDLAGPLELLKLSQIDSVFILMEKMILFFLHKIWYLAIKLTMDATVDTLIMLGIIYKILVLFLKIAGHMNLEVAKQLPAEHLASLHKLSLSTNAKRTQLSISQVKPPQRKRSWIMDLLKELLQSIKISSTTRVESINTKQEVLPEDMLLRFLVGELKTV